MTKILDRLVWRELVGPFFNSFLMFLMLLYTTVWLVRMTDWLVKGAPMGLVIQAAVYSLPVFVTQCLPMAMLLGCLLTFGRLSADSEHIALYASGISFYRIARPVALMGALVSCLAFGWNEFVVPPAQVAFFALQRKALENIEATERPISYTVQKPGGGQVDEWINVAHGFDSHERVLRDVTIVKMSDDPDRKGQPDLVLYAAKVMAKDPSGKMKDADFYDGYLRPLLPDPKGHYLADVYFKRASLSTLTKRVGFGDRDFKGVTEGGTDDKWKYTFRGLRDKVNRDRHDGYDTLADEFNLWEKVSFPFASLIFGLVAAPLGVRPHRGSRAMGFGMAMVIIFFYWVAHNWMFQLGKGGAVYPGLAAFTANILGIGAAIFLMSRTRQ